MTSFDSTPNPDRAHSDHKWMERALSLAARGEGFVEPNPMVGCVLVRDGKPIGEGFHTAFGQPHAEVEAIANCSSDCRNATAYVTLEPCCHQGKTPPCSQALIDAGVARVVVGTLDLFPKVDGGGVDQLRAAGIQVDVGLLEREARSLIAPFTRRVISKRPWVIAKWAMSLDGKIATASGESRWISNSISRAETHRLRGRVDAIMVGIGTAIADDPRLTARPAGPRTGLRVVCDSQAKLPLDSQLCQTANGTPVLIACGPNAPPEKVEALKNVGCQVWRGEAEAGQRLHDLLTYLAEQGATNVMVEGGSALLGSLSQQGLIDETHVYIASKLIGGQSAPSPVGGRGTSRLADATRLEFVEAKQHDGDVQIISRVEPPNQ